MARGVFSAKKMKRVWAKAEQDFISRQAKFKHDQKRTRESNSRREAGANERERRELEQFWQSIRDKNQQRTATEQRPRVTRAIKPISRRADGGTPRPTAANKGLTVGADRTLQQTGT